MGKNRHSKDKLYIVASEYANQWGQGKKKAEQRPFRSLPFYCCGLSLLPFTTPVCTKDGIVFDADNILAYIKQYHRNPVTGEPLTKKDLIPLRFHKNSDNHYHCPITYKEFNDYTHIVANRLSGHVYSYEAIDALCRRPQSWLDLITNEPFTPADLVTIQNPRNVALRKIDEFDHIKTGKNITKIQPKAEGVAAYEGALEASIKETSLMQHILDESKAAEETIKTRHNRLIRNVNHVPEPPEHVSPAGTTIASEDDTQPVQKHSLYTTHKQAASFTSTAVRPSYELEYRDISDKERRVNLYKAVRKTKQKGYVRLVTTLGSLNIELHCDKVPETCHNFLLHCASGYYNNSIFHRSIKHFMIQGGDPTGTGKGGQCAFVETETFPDEYHPHLLHKGPGILSMANSGKNTNRSQFFITYNSCEHLNMVHSVFGRLVGGSETLQKMEALKTDRQDRPVEPPKILEVTVFKNPFVECQKKEEASKLQHRPIHAAWVPQLPSLQPMPVVSSSPTLHQRLPTTSTSNTQHRNKKAELAVEQASKPTREQLLDPFHDHVNRHSSTIGKYANFESLLAQNQQKQVKRSAPTQPQENITTLSGSSPSPVAKKLNAGTIKTSTFNSW